MYTRQAVALSREASVSVEFSALKTRFPYFWTRAQWGGNWLLVQKNSTETLASQATVASPYPSTQSFLWYYPGEEGNRAPLI